MKLRVLLVVALTLVATMPATAGGKKKKVQPRGLLEKMEAVPCGAKQRGLTGLGSIWASAGITHVNSDEKLCPQYLLRTDDMDYEIRPMEKKHPVVLPIGSEVEFKIKKDKMSVKLPEGDHKTLTYQVVAIIPANRESQTESSASPQPEKP
jgi:hypothetical protein